MIKENIKEVIEDTREKENYDENDYYYNNALKVNIKTDSGSTKPKGRIPIWKLNLENESEIPEKPKDILDKPNDKHYEKLLKEQDDLVAFHNKSIVELKVKINKERTGNNPEVEKLQEDKKALKEELDPLTQRIKTLEARLDGPRKELEKLKLSKESLAKEIDIFKIDALNAEIKSIQSRLGFASLTIGEEKKLIDRKARLDAQKPKVNRYSEIIKQTQDIYDAYGTEFDELKDLRGKRGGLYDKLNKIQTRLDDLYNTKKQNDPAVNNLFAQKQNIRDSINACFERKKEINKEWDDKWYKYESQQKLLAYIKEAQDKINMLKKKEERERKRREREAQELNHAVTGQDILIIKQEDDILAYEIWICDWLSSYFNNLTSNIINTNKESVHLPQSQSVNSKIDEDISKGLIKPINRQAIEDEFSIGLSTSNKSKKKSKGPKVSKREQKAESNNINIDINIINKIKDVNKKLKNFILTPPVMKNDIPKFIAQLNDASKNLKLQVEEIKGSNKSKVEVDNSHTDEATQINSTPTLTKFNPTVNITKNENKNENIHSNTEVSDAKSATIENPTINATKTENLEVNYEVEFADT